MMASYELLCSLKDSRINTLTLHISIKCERILTLHTFNVKSGSRFMADPFKFICKRSLEECTLAYKLSENAFLDDITNKTQMYCAWRDIRGVRKNGRPSQPSIKSLMFAIVCKHKTKSVIVCHWHHVLKESSQPQRFVVHVTRAHQHLITPTTYKLCGRLAVQHLPCQLQCHPCKLTAQCHAA